MQAKRDYYINVFSKYSKSLKMTWRTINEASNLQRGNCDFQQKFCLANSHIISDSKQITNSFNDYFIRIDGDTHCNAPLNRNFNRYMCEEPDCNLVL